jgi:lactate permease
MEIVVLFASLILLIYIGLYLKKLWLGALLALVGYAISNSLIQGGVAFLQYPALDGLIITLELALLLFGAYMFYRLLAANNHFDALKEATEAISSKLIVLMMLCFFMISFMEGIAGFGIPAMLIAPMLLTIGFRPLTSIVLPLAANTVGVTFGALGTPLKIGLDITTYNDVVQYTAIINLLPAITMPFMLAWLYTQTEKVKIAWLPNFKLLLGAGVIYTTLFYFMSLYSIEYVSVVAGVGGLILYAAIFIPQNQRIAIHIWIKTFWPYFIFIAMLIMARYGFSLKQWQFHEHIKPLPYYQPGLVFVLAGLFYWMSLGASKANMLLSQIKQTGTAIAKPIITILFLVLYAQIIRVDLSQMAQLHLQNLSDVQKVCMSPVLGIAGSFFSGSATMSNLVFGNTIYTIAQQSVHIYIYIALLHTGSAIGNAISLQNILMVKSVVQDHTLTYMQILKYNFIVVLLYLLVAIVAGVALIA